MSILFRMLALPVVLLLKAATLVSCASGPRPVEPDTPVPIGNCSVRSPRGKGWQVEQPEASVVIFQRVRRSNDVATGSTQIVVARNRCLLKGELPGREELGTQWLDEEVRIMQDEGVRTGLFQLTDVRKGTAVIGGKRLQSMEYSQASSVRTGKDAWDATAVVFVYFPDDFDRTREMYSFLISEMNFTNRGGSSTELSQIDPVIESFRLN